MSTNEKDTKKGKGSSKKAQQAADESPPRECETDIAIDDGVPIPSVRRSAKRYPLASMKSGQSFFVPCTDDEASATSGGLRRQIRAFEKDGGGKKLFTIRRVEGGVRCWRI